MHEPRQDTATVTPDGELLARRIAGVELRYQPPVADERGEVVEMYRPTWGVHPDPLVYVYQVTIRPGFTKGWVMHKLSDDRIFVSQGDLRIGLYDARPDSPTHGLLNVLTVTERRRPLLVIPRGVYHGIQNVGLRDAMFINMPSRPYDHANPDKFRLPLKNDLIPFDFSLGRSH